LVPLVLGPLGTTVAVKVTGDPKVALDGEAVTVVVVGARVTPTVAVAVSPVPPLVEVTAEVVLTFEPTEVAVTVTLKVHEPEAAIEAPARLTVLEPAVAVIVPPPQLPDRPLGVETTKPEGSVSVKPTPDSPTVAFGFETVKVRLVEPPKGIDETPNALASVGGATTVTDAVAVLPEPALVEVTVTELFLTPAVVAVTFTENVQVAPAASVAPAKETVAVAFVAVMVPPPQVPLLPGGVDTTKPAGRVSVKPTPVRLNPALFGLLMVKVSDVEPPTGMVAAPNALVIAGGEATDSVAVAVLPVPPLVELTVTELFLAPEVVPVTLTENVQVPPAAMAAPLRLTVLDPAVAVMVPPPQVPVRPLGVETTRPDGNVSVKATPVSATVLAAGLVMVKVSEVVPFNATVEVPKLLAMTGGATTTNVAVAVAPVPPLVEEMAPVVLVKEPAAVPVTLTVMVQVALAAKVAPLRVTLVPPAVAKVLPPQLVVIPRGVATTIPAGRLSVKATPVSDTVALGLATVNDRVVEPPSGTDDAPNALVSVGGATTVIDAVAVLPVPELVVVTVTELFFTPAVVPVTLTENVQDALSPRVAPLRLTLVEPAVAVIVPPPQVPVRPLGVDTTRPAGKVSVKATPVTATALLGLVMVKPNEVEPFSGIVAAPKLLEIEGGVATSSVAIAVLPVPPLVDEMVTELTRAPAVVPSTLTVMVQLPPIGIRIPDAVTVVDPALAMMAASAQVLAAPLGVAMTIPEGKVSVKPTPFSGPFTASVLAAGLVRVKVRVEVPLSATSPGENDLAITGGATTTSVAVAVPPVPPLVEVTAPVVLTSVPAAMPVTFTEKVHDALAANVAPLRLTLVDPAVAVIVPPPHEPVRPLGVLTTRPEGSVSLKAIPDRDTVEFGFDAVKVRLVDPPSGTDDAPNDLDSVGGATTVTEAVAVLPVPPLVEVTVTELFFTPAVVPVTFTENVQAPPSARVAPLRLTLVEAAVAVIVPPPHVPVRPLGVLTTRPLGNESLKAIPVDDPLPAGLVMVKLNVVEPLSAMVLAPKDLAINTGDATNTVAVAVLPVPPLVDVTDTELFLAPEVVAVTLSETVQLLLVARVTPLRLTLPDAGVAVMLPPQDVLKMFGVATTRPAGRVSVNATPTRGTVLAAGLVMVMMSEVVPLRAMLAAPKLLAITGGATTVKVAVAVEPVPPSFEVTAPVVFTWLPAAVPVTFTVKVHDPAGPRAAPLRLTVDEAAVAVIVPPPHEPVRPFGVLTTRPDGNVSVNATPESDTVALGLETVKLSVVDPFSGTDAAPNALVRPGGATTVIDAVDVLPVPPEVELTVTALFFTPAVAPVTLTEKVQLAPALRDAPVRLTVDEAAVAVMVPPPQVPVKPLGVDTTRPEGSVSVNAMPVEVPLAEGLVMVNDRVVEPPSGMVEAPKDLAIMTGPAATVIEALASGPKPPLSEATIEVTLL